MKTIHVAVIALLSTYLAAQNAAPRASKTSAAATRTPATATSAARQPSMEMLNSFMHHMFGYDPMVKWKIQSVQPSEVPGATEVVVAFGDPVQQTTAFYVASDLQHAFIGQIIPFGSDPFAPARTKLQEQAKGPVQGNPSASVEIVEFSDFECPHCKRAQPKLEQLMNESPDARLVFENFPLSRIHKWADRASGYADCIARDHPEQFWKFAHAVYEQQEQINADNAAPKLNAIATDAGADAGVIAACADSPETKARVNQQYELGVSVGVNATPTLFLNGRKIENVNDTPIEVLKQMIEFEASQAKK